MMPVILEKTTQLVLFAITFLQLALFISYELRILLLPAKKCIVTELILIY